ncbi:MAG: hypothetical protein M1818_008068 [Claussenomyces sp. TS43310]|nr:MAG: hypothetical protein M1818_008068 [Claussenomyces sp. TS43310]
MGQYTASHVNSTDSGDTRPTALQIVKDQGLEGKLAGRVIVITDCTATGATLLLTVRDLQKAEDILTDILEPIRVSLIQMDNTSFARVRAGAKTILVESNNQVNIVINNAGVMGIEEVTLTEDGHEVVFATKHLAHFLLFQLLKPALLASSNPDFNSRVVNVATSSHRLTTINPSDNYNIEKGGYSHALGYAQSKAATVYMSSMLWLVPATGDKKTHSLSTR